MKTEIIKNKEGETMTTKTGEPLVKNTLELGDELIPTRNKVFVEEREVEIKGKKSKLKNYSVLCNIRNSEGKVYTQNDKQELFVDLSEGQAKNFLNKKEEGTDITQHIWRTYEYSNEYGNFLGIGIKGQFQKPKTFEELDAESEEETILEEKTQ